MSNTMSRILNLEKPDSEKWFITTVSANFEFNKLWVNCNSALLVNDNYKGPNFNIRLHTPNEILRSHIKWAAIIIHEENQYDSCRKLCNLLSIPLIIWEHNENINKDCFFKIKGDCTNINDFNNQIQLITEKIYGYNPKFIK